LLRHGSIANAVDPNSMPKNTAARMCRGMGSLR
jgi:hypothetical protein